ncbi:MAG: hypothetical protein QG608_123 [Actinomycetota bacterium]|nr:hypothetical protein [Actinomycetota bacterium]
MNAALPDTTDADTAVPTPTTLFTPDTHRVALSPDVSVVRGGRGTGKTVWFSVMLDPQLREVAAESYRMPQVRKIDPVPGFGAKLDPDRYPGWRVMERLLEIQTRPEQIWDAVLVTALDCSEITGTSWEEKAEWVRRNPEARERILHERDLKAGHDGRIVLLLFDALDRLHPCRRTADTLATGILKLALDLRLGTRNLRAKVFIRPDMLSSVERRFPDASKLMGNAADLTWTQTNLYGLLFHRLGNAASVRAAQFRDSFPDGKRSDAQTEQGKPLFVPPPRIITDQKTQKPIFEQLAGPYMGAGHRKGHTYTWLPNHLVDGLGEVSPRSFLSALRVALSTTTNDHNGHPFALHYQGIRRGVQEASRIRVEEIAEDIPWVRTTVRALEGLQVPAEVRDIEQRWLDKKLVDSLRRSIGDPGASAPEQDAETGEKDIRVGPRDPGDARALIEELKELGIMRTRADGRLDLPDVYRVAFGLGRRGGIPSLPRP